MPSFGSVKNTKKTRFLNGRDLVLEGLQEHMFSSREIRENLQRLQEDYEACTVAMEDYEEDLRHWGGPDKLAGLLVERAYIDECYAQLTEHCHKALDASRITVSQDHFPKGYTHQEDADHRTDSEDDDDKDKNKSLWWDSMGQERNKQSTETDETEQKQLYEMEQKCLWEAEQKQQLLDIEQKRKDEELEQRRLERVEKKEELDRTIRDTQRQLDQLKMDEDIEQLEAGLEDIGVDTPAGRKQSSRRSIGAIGFNPDKYSTPAMEPPLAGKRRRILKQDVISVPKPSILRASDQEKLSYVREHLGIYLPSGYEQRLDLNTTVRECAEETPFDCRHMLEKIKPPIFTGIKTEYSTWWATFHEAIDKHPQVHVTYKFAKLRECLQGDATIVLAGLNCSPGAYVVAKDRLVRTYGGEDREVAMRLEEIKKLRQVRENNPKDLERLLGAVEVLVVSLLDSGNESELRGCTLLGIVKHKLTTSMLVSYKRWVRVNGERENVETLRDFLAEEVGYIVTASEDIHGIVPEKTTRGTSGRTMMTTGGESSKESRGGARPKDKDYSTQMKCKLCDGAHGIWKCDKFKALAVSDRWERAKEYRLCFRCLSVTHRSDKCSRSRPCGIQGCKHLHHVLLHSDSQRPYSGKRSDGNPPTGKDAACAAPRLHDHTDVKQPIAASASKVSTPKPDNMSLVTVHQHRGLIGLRTVPVRIGWEGKSVVVNALLDDGSTMSYINEAVVTQLGLEGEPVEATVGLLNDNHTTLRTSKVRFDLESLDGDTQVRMSAMVTKKVTGSLKVIDWREYQKTWPHLRDITFAPVSKPTVVDILLGLDVHKLHDTEDEISGPPDAPVARLTKLGWTCIGPVSNEPTALATHHSFCQYEDQLELSQLVKSWWRIDDIPDQPKLTPEEQAALDMIKSSTTFVDGHFKVGMPWVKGRPPALHNRDLAMKRFLSTERRLERDPKVKELYEANFENYKNKGYIRLVPENEIGDTGNYLPHFPVTKLDRQTTKVRAVFDASAIFRGHCLNEYLHTGPKLQLDILDVLMQFREFKIGITCDVSEMYLQVRLEEEDIKYTRFLLRSKDGKRMSTYEFLVWLFGLKPSPCVAIAASHVNAEKHAKELPAASNVVLKSTYMDDSMTSSPTVKDGRQLVKDLRELWSSAGMNAPKWAASDAEVLADVAPEDRAVGTVFTADGLPLIKTLGVSWCAATDTFTFYVNVVQNKTQWTKREYLSKMAAVFDPLGLVTPTVTQAKVLFQEMWQTGAEWDDLLPERLCERACLWFDRLHRLRDVKVPRALKSREHVLQCQIHIFADASQDAYGAVAYLRVQYEDGSIEVSLCMSKGRVAPLKSLSIPRLELMASMTGLKLGERLMQVLHVDVRACFHWSDSMDVVCWARSPSRKYKPFIANRVGEIQRHSLPDNWRHFGAKVNPADLLSRGVPPDMMAMQELWWKGPDFLHQDEAEWPPLPAMLADRKLPEERKGYTGFAVGSPARFQSLGDVLQHVQDTQLCPWRYSSWNKMLRVMAWVMCYLVNCMQIKEERAGGTLSPEELRDAEVMYIGLAQRQEFSKERGCLLGKQDVPVNSRLAPLNVWLDEEGVIRSGGRLQKAESLSWETRNPTVLPRQHWITTLLIRETHQLNGHSGLNATLASLNERFWIVAGREAVRSELMNCRACRRAHPRPVLPKMAALPDYRVTTSLQAFDRVSVDYGGPFSTKVGRGKTRNKRYLCLFTCLAVRAVHLEMAYALDTAGFLNCFSRMTATRGVPSLVISDNGTNFVGAVVEIKQLVAALDKQKIQDSTCYQKVTWRFQPPAAPHFSGVHERMIGAAKRAIYTVLSGADLTDEELVTAIKVAEGLINSRPLLPVSSDVRDELVLTPNHFIMGRLGKNFVPESVDKTPFPLRNRWRRVQELANHFWERWHTEWLPSLGGRAKWRRDGPGVKAGDIVVVLDQPMQRGKWAIGRITAVYPGDDGVVRAVDVLVNGTIYRRPAVRLSQLESV